MDGCSDFLLACIQITALPEKQHVLPGYYFLFCGMFSTLLSSSCIALSYGAFYELHFWIF